MKKFLLICSLILLPISGFAATATGCKTIAMSNCTNMQSSTTPNCGGTYNESPQCLDCAGSRILIIECANCPSGYVKQNFLYNFASNDTTYKIYYSRCSIDTSGDLDKVCMTTNSGCSGTAVEIPNCKAYETKCFGGNTVNTCTECNTGYTTTTAERSFAGCTNTFTQTICEQKTCAGDKTLNTTTGNCECPNGKYSTGTTTCGTCPEWSVASTLSGCGVFTANGGVNGISDCYRESIKTSGVLAKQCVYEDDVGDFIYTNDCYYSESE